jgi:hypothetical protein
MTHDTNTRQEGRKLKQKAWELVRKGLAEEKQGETARLEDITMWRDSMVRQTAKG